MAAVLRTGIANISPKALLGGLCKATPKYRNAVVTQVAFISGRDLRRDRPPKPPPFDWRNKEYGRWWYLMDPMEERFDENTKLIVVEGLPAVGKDKFARQLAEELEMQYLKQPSYDEAYTDPTGFDLRKLNSRLPENAQFYDTKSFLEKPDGINTAAYQLGWFQMRCHQYIDTLCDILSSGQGAIVQRSPFSDINFMEAMYRQGFVSRGAVAFYKAAVTPILEELMKPHLVLYLDAPISVIKDNIKKRNIPYEVNSKALTDKYLQDLEKIYKEYLRETTKHSHLLIYDWSREGDIGVVVEDIERLDFDSEKSDSEKFADWRYDHISVLKVRRGDYCTHKDRIMSPIHVANFDVPEMWQTAEEALLLDALTSNIASVQYEEGFNPEVDKGILFKLRHKFEHHLRQGQIEKKEQ